MNSNKFWFIVDIDSYLKEANDFEIKRKDDINKSLDLPATLLIVLFGGLSFLIRNYIQYIMDIDIIDLVFILLVILTITFLARSSFFLLRSLMGYTYAYMPYEKMKKLSDYLNNKYNNMADKERLVQARFNKLVTELHLKNISINATNNHNKLQYKYKAIRNIMYATIVLFLTAIPYFLEIYRHTNEG